MTEGEALAWAYKIKWQDFGLLGYNVLRKIPLVEFHPTIATFSWIICRLLPMLSTFSQSKQLQAENHRFIDYMYIVHAVQAYIETEHAGNMEERVMHKTISKLPTVV